MPRLRLLASTVENIYSTENGCHDLIRVGIPLPLHLFFGNVLKVCGNRTWTKAHHFWGVVTAAEMLRCCRGNKILRSQVRHLIWAPIFTFDTCITSFGWSQNGIAFVFVLTGQFYERTKNASIVICYPWTRCLATYDSSSFNDTTIYSFVIEECLESHFKGTKEFYIRDAGLFWIGILSFYAFTQIGGKSWTWKKWQKSGKEVKKSIESHLSLRLKSSLFTVDVAHVEKNVALLSPLLLLSYSMPSSSSSSSLLPSSLSPSSLSSFHFLLKEVKNLKEIFFLLHFKDRLLSLKARSSVWKKSKKMAKKVFGIARSCVQQLTDSPHSWIIVVPLIGRSNH